MQRYVIREKVGEGCFGTVHSAVDSVTGELVAVKRIPICRVEEGLPHNVSREVLISERVEHKNILRVREVFAHAASLCMVTDRCETDLSRLLRCFDWSRRLPLWFAKHLMQDLLRGLRYLHGEGILHRDVKPSNCLLSSDVVLQLSDFGLARRYSAGADMTHEVASRWYRAPELLFGCRRYSSAVDMWSAGCVFAELLSGCGDSVLFSGDGDIDQISRIFEILGSPTAESWPTHETLPDWGKIVFNETPGAGLQALFPDADADALHLLKGLLTLDPIQRLDADAALRHPFFCSDPLPAVPSEPLSEILRSARQCDALKSFSDLLNRVKSMS